MYPLVTAPVNGGSYSMAAEKLALTCDALMSVPEVKIYGTAIV